MKVRVAKLAQVPPKRKKLNMTDLQLVLVQELWQKEKGKEEDERVVDVVGKKFAFYEFWEISCFFLFFFMNCCVKNKLFNLPYTRSLYIDIQQAATYRNAS